MIPACRTLNVIFVFALLLLIPESTVLAADITVDETCSLADAITAANEDEAKGGCPAGNGADVIFLTSDVVLSAELPFIVSQITVEGNGYAISGDLSHRIFSVGETALTLNHITLQDGRSRSGSAIYSSLGAMITIRTSMLKGNVAYASILDFGGAIYCWPCDLEISNSVLRNNTSSGDGGAIYFAGYGEAKYRLRISESIFEKNNATRGAGVYIAGLRPMNIATIEKSEFAGNWASKTGGGIYHAGPDTQWGGQLIIENSTFRHNSAYDGDGIYFDKHTVNRLSHVTLANNSGSSIYVHALSKTDLDASIIARHSRNSLCFGSPSVINDSIIEDGSCGAPLEGDAMLGMLFEPADGSPSYYPLMPGSPAIDAVDCDRGITADQIGTPRPQGALCDLGAIEFVQDLADEE